MQQRSAPLEIALRLRGEPTCDVCGQRRALEPLAAALLALVAINRDVSRERAAALLWPASADPRGALRQQLARFRRLAGADLIEGTDRLRLAAGVVTDIEHVPATDEADSMSTPHGSLLGDLRFPDQPAFDAWLTRQRSRAPAAGASPTAVKVPSSASLPATLLRPPQVIGREAALAALMQAWDAGQAVLLLGEAGLGKSRLLAEFARSRCVLTAAARPGDAGVPYATLTRLLRLLAQCCTFTPADHDRHELARLLPEMAPGADLPAEGHRLALQAAIVHVLGDAQWSDEHATSVPLDGLIVDDLHFADDASIEMLQALVAALASRLRFAFAQRPGEGSAAAQALRDALQEGGLLTAQVMAPLSEVELGSLVDSLHIDDLDAARLASALSRHTGGNPLFALETIKQGLASGQLRTGELPRPATVGALIAQRLARLSPRALALARAAAVAGVDFDVALAEYVTSERALALADAWSELQSAQVLQDAAFAHDLVAQTVVEGLPAAVARELHGAIARWLQDRGGEPARIAQHWLDAGEPGAALPWLHRAAEKARHTLRPREAADFLQQAFDIERELAPQAQAFATLERLLQLRLLVDQDAALLALIDRMDALAATPKQQAAALLARADFRMHRFDGLVEGRAAAERAAQLADESGEPLLQLEARATGAVLQAMCGDYEIAARNVDAFIGEVPMVEDTPHRCNLLGKGAYVMARAGRTREGGALFDEAARQAQAHPQVQLVALANAAQARLQLNDPEGALARLQRSDALRAAHDGLKGSGHANAWMTVWALRLLGRYAEALALFDALIAEMAVRSPGKLASVYVDRAILWLELGQPARAHQDREHARRVMVRHDHVGLHLLDLRMAAASARPMPGTPTLSMPHIYSVQAQLLESGLLVGEARASRIEQALAEARRCGYRGLEASALARRARLLAEAGEPEAAVADARSAAALAEGRNTDDLSFPALALQAAGVLQAAGQGSEARALLGSAVAWLERVAAPLPLPFQSSLRERNPVHRLLLERAHRD